MRWFTDEARQDDGDAWERAVAAYAAHVAAVAPQLPPDLARLVTDPRLDLKDGRFREVVLDRADASVVMTIDCGDLQVGYRRVTLAFADAAFVTEDLSRIADAIGAEFRPNHWHVQRTVTEIRAQEIDVTTDGRYILRLRLWPFHEFAIECSGVRLDETDLPSREPARPGTFTVRT